MENRTNLNSNDVKKSYTLARTKLKITQNDAAAFSNRLPDHIYTQNSM